MLDLKNIIAPSILDILRFYKSKIKYNFSDAICESGKLYGKIVLGKGSSVRQNTELYNVTFGKYSGVNSNSCLRNVNVGNFTSIGEYCRIGLLKHPLNNITTIALHQRHFARILGSELLAQNEASSIYYGDTNIGHDVWIGDCVIIPGGISIGNGSVIGAGAVVTKDVSPFSVVVGVPAKLVKYRFTEKQIQYIEKLQWWLWSDEEIKKNANLFISLDKWWDYCENEIQ
jgi:acetyltransferase-like isoleucine patch superfamily enzyme